MTEHGTIIISRGLFDHPRFKREDFTEIQAWIWLVCEAAWRPHVRRVSTVEITLQRGQLAHSLRHMAREWRWDESRVRRYLAKLEGNPPKTDALIDAAVHSGITVITICKYDVYQLRPAEVGGARAAAIDAGSTQDRRNKEFLEFKEEEAALLRARARELAFQVYDIFGFDREFIPPNWMGLSYWLEAGMSSAGWKPDLVRLAASRVAAKAKSRGQTIKKYTFLEGPINDAHNEAAPVVPPSAIHPVKESADASVQPGRQRQLNLVRPIAGGYASRVADILRRQSEGAS